MMDLVLNLKSKWFEEIKKGFKVVEFREYNDYWKKRLEGKEYDNIYLIKGYPKGFPYNCDPEKRMVFPYIGYLLKTIKHEEFGDKIIPVFAIPLVKE